MRYDRMMPGEEDKASAERFLRVVGQRQPAPVGQPPRAASRAAMAANANYRTRAPKGVFRYRSHEEANADRDRWLVDAIVAAAHD